MNRLLATFVFCLLLAPFVAKAEIIDRIVARVNDDVVTLYDVRQAAVPYVLQQGLNPAILEQPGRRATLYKEVLEDLIDRKLLVQEAAKLELSIKDDELDQWLAYTREQQGMTQEQFAAMIAQYGMRTEAYREMVRQNLLKIRMIKIKVGSQVNVTEEEVNKVYRERYGSDGAAEKFITVSHILFRPNQDTPEEHAAARQRGLAVLKRLAAGEDFETVAREASEGPTAPKGGFLGTFRRGELDPDFEAVAFAQQPGRTSELVKTKFGYHIILVTAVEERESADGDERRDLIRGELQQLQAERLLKQYLLTLRTRSFVDVRY